MFALPQLVAMALARRSALAFEVGVTDLLLNTESSISRLATPTVPRSGTI